MDISLVLLFPLNSIVLLLLRLFITCDNCDYGWDLFLNNYARDIDQLDFIARPGQVNRTGICRVSVFNGLFFYLCSFLLVMYFYSFAFKTAVKSFIVEPNNVIPL